MLYHKIKKHTPIIFFGHRGAPQLIKENTIESIEKSIEIGCHGIETDIQITKDNQIILFHDHHVKDNQQTKPISALHYNDIKKIFQEKKENPPSKIEELIFIMKKNPNIIFNLEIKTLKVNNYKILKILKNKISKEILNNQCILSSFNFLLIFTIKHYYDDCNTAIIIGKNRT